MQSSAILDAARGPRQRAAPSAYLRALTAAFTLFSSIRVFGYLPTVVSILQAGDSSQHSVLTWLTWLCANLTMALWLHEHNGRRVDRAVAVNAVNAAMCAVTAAAIGWTRL